MLQFETYMKSIFAMAAQLPKIVIKDGEQINIVSTTLKLRLKI